MKKLVVLIHGRPELVEWWDRADFHGRFTMVVGADENMQPVPDSEQLSVIPVSDDCIICDYCNADLLTFPVPVVGGSALCPKCFKKLVP
jgi:hypothetical protein